MAGSGLAGDSPPGAGAGGDVLQRAGGSGVEVVVDRAVGRDPPELGAAEHDEPHVAVRPLDELAGSRVDGELAVERRLGGGSRRGGEGEGEEDEDATHE